MSQPPQQTIWQNEAQTEAFAMQLAQTLRPLLPRAGGISIALEGDLGAGKTTLVRYVLRALGVAGRIKSPSYAIVESYETAHFPVWHFDFYRLGSAEEWEDAGFRDVFASQGLKLAEWPEKAAALIPAADVAIHIEALDEDARQVTLRAHTPLGHRLLQGLSA